MEDQNNTSTTNEEVKEEIKLPESIENYIPENVGVFVSMLGIPAKIPTAITEWVVTPTYGNFVDFINTYIDQYHHLPELMVFDCCLSEAQLMWFSNSIGGIPQFDKFKDKSGYHCVSFIMELCDIIGINPNTIAINGDNPGNWILGMVLEIWKKEQKKTFPLHKISYEVKKFEDIGKEESESSTD